MKELLTNLKETAQEKPLSSKILLRIIASNYPDIKDINQGVLLMIEETSDLNV